MRSLPRKSVSGPGAGKLCDWWATVGPDGAEAAADEWSDLVTRLIGEEKHILACTVLLGLLHKSSPTTDY